MANIISLLNPFSSEYHAIKDFEKIQSRKKIFLTITLTVLATLVSLPILGLGGVATFRTLVGRFSRIRLGSDSTGGSTSLGETASKVDEQRMSLPASGLSSALTTSTGNDSLTTPSARSATGGVTRQPKGGNQLASSDGKPLLRTDLSLRGNLRERMGPKFRETHPFSLEALRRAVLAMLSPEKNAWQLFQAYLETEGYKLNHVQIRAIIREYFLVECSNIARVKVIANERDVACARKKLEAAFQPSSRIPNPIKNNVIFNGADVKGGIMTGVCLGTTLEFGYECLKFINSGTDKHEREITALAERNKSGVGEKAAANQIAYQTVKGKSAQSVGHLMRLMCESLEKGRRNEGLFNCDFGELRNCLAILRRSLTIDPGGISPPTPPMNSRVNIFRTILDELIQEQGINGTWYKKNDWENQITDIPAFMAAMTERINTYSNSDMLPEALAVEKEHNLTMLRWLVSCLQYTQAVDENIQAERNGQNRPHQYSTDKVEDPEIRYFMQLFRSDIININQARFAAATADCKLTHVSDVVGPVCGAYSDDTFLDNMRALKPGCYCLILYQQEGGHAINYIKISEDHGYLYDPNFGLIKCDTGKRKVILEALLAFYEEPKDKPDFIKAKHHNLKIYQIESSGIPQIRTDLGASLP